MVSVECCLIFYATSYIHSHGKNLELGWSTSKKRQPKRIPEPQSSQKNPPKKNEVLNDFMEQIHQNLQGVLYRFVLCKCVDALVPHLWSGRIWVWQFFKQFWLFLESWYLLFPFIKRRKHIFICIYAFVVLLWFIPPQNGSFRIHDLYTWTFQFGCLTWFQKRLSIRHLFRD